jgi:hypothetical protein
MNQKLEREQAEILFTENQLKYFFSRVVNYINNYIIENGTDEKLIIGTIGFDKVPMTNGKETSVILCFQAEIFPNDYVDASIYEFIIFDEFSDDVLDAYNEVVSLIKENKKS